MCGTYSQICESLQKNLCNFVFGSTINFMTYNSHLKFIQFPFKWLGLNYTLSASVNINRSTEGYRASRFKEELDTRKPDVPLSRTKTNTTTFFIPFRMRGITELHTVDWEIFTLKIIHVKNFHGVKFSWFHPIRKHFLTVDGHNRDEHLEHN